MVYLLWGIRVEALVQTPVAGDQYASANRNRGVRSARDDVHVARTWTLPLVVGLALSACGGDDSPRAADKEPAAAGKEPAAVDTAVEAESAAKPRKGTKIKLGDSDFGTMLFDSKDQAIYVFEKDPKGKSVCYRECARAWPPVLTKGKPRAGEGVRKSLLGTVKRRDGRRQVTYAGKPLYFYSHEGPGEVLCHNVNLNGGLWWVVGPGGRPRP
jgi:predicted lipoprotein with Yx(FWY)xxD motif